MRRVSAVSTSSAENGSSISSMLGWTTSARAKPTRWRMPPDSSRGIGGSRSRRGRSGRWPPGRALRISAGHARASRPSSTFSQHGQPGKQREALEHHGDARRRARPRAGRDSRPRRRLGSDRPAMMRSRVDLPEPERPSRPTISPSRKRQVDVVEHQQLRSPSGLAESAWRTSLHVEQDASFDRALASIDGRPQLDAEAALGVAR